MGLAGKHILLIITGGIAAYKSLELIRLITKAGGSVQPILTKAATEFVTPLSVASLSGHEALCELFDLTREAKIGHIELSRSADLIVVAPASADFLAKMAQGRADDLASTTVLATDTEILVAPAMNVRMWQAAATQRNMATLTQDGVAFVGPDEGEMACGEYGPGRMAEPAAIVSAIARHLTDDGEKALTGKHFIVTSGPTQEWLDPVRYLSNASSGKQGTAIAKALLDLGANVTFVTGPADVSPPTGCTIVPVISAVEMRDAVMAALPADGAIFCAAVADWRFSFPQNEKLKKAVDATPPNLTLTQNPDILAEVAQLPDGQRPALVVGFAAETENLLVNGRAKLAAKKCDWILANSVASNTETFGGDRNHVVFINRDIHDDWGDLSKSEVAHKLGAAVDAFLSTI